LATTCNIVKREKLSNVIFSMTFPKPSTLKVDGFL
jgi:hypothetical protein